MAGTRGHGRGEGAWQGGTGPRCEILDEQVAHGACDLTGVPLPLGYIHLQYARIRVQHRANHGQRCGNYKGCMRVIIIILRVNSGCGVPPFIISLGGHPSATVT